MPFKRHDGKFDCACGAGCRLRKGKVIIMKKFMKGCAITAAVLCLLGLLLAVAGGTARGSAAISEVVRKVTGGRVTVDFDGAKDWGVVIGEAIENVEIVDSIDTGILYDINEHSIFGNDHKTYKGDVAKYRLGTGIRDLDIEVGGCVLETLPSGDDSFYVEVEKAYKFQGYVEDDTLYIKASNGAKTWNRMGSCKITLYVPEYFWFGTVDMEMGAGVLEFSDLRAEGGIFLQVGAGQILIDNIQSEVVTLEIGAGEVELKNMEVWGMLSAEVGMGNFEAAGVIMGEVFIECSMGNVNLELADGEQDYNYNLECAMGNIDIGDRSYSGLAKEMTLDNCAWTTVDIKCAMGNVTVTFAEDGSTAHAVEGGVTQQVTETP